MACPPPAQLKSRSIQYFLTYPCPAMDLVTETRFYPEKVSPKPFTFGALFMGVLPFVCLGPKGSCLFQVDNLNQSTQVSGRPITKNFHYQ